MPNVIIDVAAEFTGKKAFDKAGKATTGLEHNVKKLAGAFGLAFSTRAVTNFTKASIKAFAEDDRAITVLRTNLKNLGLAYQSTNAENFIAKLEQQSAILDDELRPAYSQLSKVTLSTTKTQELMALAVDLARSNGLEFASVIKILSRAYVGNYKGLKQLNIGLTDAELKTKNFAEIQAILIQQSKGAGKAYIETFAGSVDKLSVSANNAKENIGAGLVDLFADMAGNGDIQQATANVDKLSEAVGQFLKDVSEYNFFDYVNALLTGQVTESTASKLVKRPSARRFFTGGSGKSDAQLQKEKQAREEKAAKAAAAAKIKADKLAAAAKVKADKLAAENAAKLAKAGAMFDLDKIQIEAALKGKITDEESLRLRLQQAILNEDAATAEKLQKQLEASQRATAALQGQINGIKPLADPFAAWLTTLEDIATTLSAILGTKVNMTSSSIMNPNPNSAVGGPGVGTQTPSNNAVVPVVVVDPIPEVPTPPNVPETNNSFAGLGGSTGGFGFSLPSYLQNTIPQAPITVNVTNNGSVIMQDEFVAAVNDAVITANINGFTNLRPGALAPDLL